MMFIVDRSFRAFSSLAKPRQFHAGVAVEIEDSAFYVFVGGDEGGVLEVYGEKVVPPSEPPSTAPPTTTPQPTITLPPSIEIRTPTYSSSLRSPNISFSS